MPDFRVDIEGLGDETAPSTSTLAELKVIHCNRMRYASDGAGNVNDGHRVAVQRRASALQKEYEDKARECDTEYGNTPVGTDGPVLQRLQSYGHVLDLVVGHFGEWSTGIKRLVTAAAEQARPRARARRAAH